MPISEKNLISRLERLILDIKVRGIYTADGVNRSQWTKELFQQRNYCGLGVNF